MNKLFNKIVIALTGLAMSAGASAATITCTGTVMLVTIHQPGFVGVRLSSMNDQAFVCRLDADYYPAGAAMITPSVCKAIYAGLLTAKVNKETINALWFDGDAVPTSCTSWIGAAQVNLRFLPIG